MKHTYAGEVQFRRYSDTSTQGQMVTFALPSRDELDAFIGLEGKRFQAVFVLIGDDEQPAEPPVDDRPFRGVLCRWTAIRCTEPAFITWLEEAYPAIWMEHFLRLCDAEEAAAAVVRSLCGVASRVELDTNEAAAHLLHESIRKPYSAWLKKGPR